MIDQNAIYEFRGASFTGKIVGQSGGNLIILLDFPLPDGSKAALVPPGIVRPLNCRWCRDTQRVTTQFTGAQLAADVIPTKPCPYC